MQSFLSLCRFLFSDLTQSMIRLLNHEVLGFDKGDSCKEPQYPFRLRASHAKKTSRREDPGIRTNVYKKTISNEVTYPFKIPRSSENTQLTWELTERWNT